jgi:putative transposase
MPVGKKKSSTTPLHPSTSVPAPVESEATVLPTQSDFHQHLRTQVRNVMRDFLQSVLREELDAFIGCQWGEHSPNRQGYRNGYYQRDLATTSGKIEGLKVPREREGQFQTQLFESYHRYEPQVEAGLSAMFVAGVSTAKVGQIAQTLMGVAPSKSAVSRLNADLSDQLEEWHKRKLASQWQIIYLDGVYYKVRHGAEAVSMPLVIALGVDQAGHKEVLALRASAEESKAGWQLLLEDLRERGVGQGDAYPLKNINQQHYIRQELNQAASDLGLEIVGIPEGGNYTYGDSAYSIHTETWTVKWR